MPGPDREADPGRKTTPRFDDWPVERHGDYAEWPIERATPAEERPVSTEENEPELIGFVGGGAIIQDPFLFDPHTSSIVAGELDEENERIVVDEDHERHEVESEASLGERIEEFGEERSWTWLSSFAHEYLEDDSDLRSHGLELEHTEFDRRNLTDAADPDLAFVATHTFTDASGRVYSLERDFEAFLSGEDRATVAVEEKLLAAEAPRERRRDGDATTVADSEFELEVDGGDSPAPDERIEGFLREWHADHVRPRTAERPRSRDDPERS